MTGIFYELPHLGFWLRYLTARLKNEQRQNKLVVVWECEAIHCLWPGLLTSDLGGETKGLSLIGNATWVD